MSNVVSFSAHSVQVISAAQTTLLRSALLCEPRPGSWPEGSTAVQRNQEPAHPRERALLYTQKAFSFEKLEGLVRLYIWEKSPVK